MPIAPESGTKIASLPNSRFKPRPSATQEADNFVFVAAFGAGSSPNGNNSFFIDANSSYLTLRNFGAPDADLWYSFTDYPSVILAEAGNLLKAGERQQLDFSFPTNSTCYVTSTLGGIYIIVSRGFG